jgi:hypothetical protein
MGYNMRGRKTFTVGLAAAAICAAPAASFAYGPGGGGGGPTAPGFGPTISSTIVDADGGNAAGVFHKCHLKVIVPPTTFAHPVNVVISRITNVSADKHLAKGEASVCAFGVGFFREGNEIHVAKGRPSVQLTITGDPVHASDHLFTLIQGGASTHKRATFSAGAATSTLRTTRALAIVRSTS